MHTQKEQLDNAENAYLMPLNKDSSRFAVYLDNQPKQYDNQPSFRVLWPSDCGDGKKSKEILSGQKYSTLNNYPAFHFHLKGGNYSKRHEVAETLQEINPKLTIYIITGFAPSLLLEAKAKV